MKTLPVNTEECFFSFCCELAVSTATQFRRGTSSVFIHISNLEKNRRNLLAPVRYMCINMSGDHGSPRPWPRLALPTQAGRLVDPPPVETRRPHHSSAF